MKKFFSSAKFKIILYLLVLMAGFMAYAGVNGRWSAAPQELLASALVPVQKLGRLITGGLDSVRRRTVAVDDILAENDALREELTRLREELVDYNDMKAENELYRDYYQIADTYRDYALASAFVIGRDPLEKYYSFTIDRGSRDGIEVDDVVIIPEGVVGRVFSVSRNYAEVLTLLDPAVSMGSCISRTRDIGLAEGDAMLAQDGRLRMSYLPRETLVTASDLVVTTGLGGVFPAGLIVGTVEDVRAESSGKSMYAVIRPAVDVASITSVFVITDYTDQPAAQAVPESAPDAGTEEASAEDPSDGSEMTDVGGAEASDTDKTADHATEGDVGTDGPVGTDEVAGADTAP